MSARLILRDRNGSLEFPKYTNDPHEIHISVGRCPMTDLIKKHSISSELAQKMADAALAKARALGVSENVAILDDGGNLKAFSRMDGAPILCIQIAHNKAYPALFGLSTHQLFDFIIRDP